MDEHCCNSYYALVWSTTLNEDVVVKGERLERDVVLPKGPSMLYGTNDNDVLVVRNVEFETIIEYDVMKTEQRVRFVKIVEEISIPRDIRIIVWSGLSELEVAQGTYKILTPTDFEDMVRVAGEHTEGSHEFTSPSDSCESAQLSDLELRDSLHRKSVKNCNESLSKLIASKSAGRLRDKNRNINLAVTAY